MKIYAKEMSITLLASIFENIIGIIFGFLSVLIAEIFIFFIGWVVTGEFGVIHITNFPTIGLLIFIIGFGLKIGFSVSKLMEPIRTITAIIGMSTISLAFYIWINFTQNIFVQNITQKEIETLKRLFIFASGIVLFFVMFLLIINFVEFNKRKNNKN